MQPIRRARSAGLFFVCALAVPAPAWCQARPGLITSVAGTGVYGFSGERGPGVRAQLDSVYAIAVDARGNVYIADSWNHRVRMLTPDGSISTAAGTGTEGYAGDGGPATAARLFCPRGLAADAQGNLFIADSGNSRVRKVGPDGTITTVAGSGAAGYSGDGGPATSALLNFPRGLAVDSKGNLYIADGRNYRVRKVTPEGIISTLAGTGVYGYSGDGGRAAAAQLGMVQSLAVDAQGNLFVADAYNHCVRKVTPEGFIVTVAGGGGYGAAGDGGLAESAQLRYPRGLAVDPRGNLFVADAGNHRIRRITPAGSIATVAGTGVKGYSGDLGSASCARLDYPYGVAVDAQGTLVIADLRNYRIRKAWLEEVAERPAVPPGGLVSGAGVRGPVAPGSLISVYGQRLAYATCSAGSLPLPIALGGASVTVGGRTVPLMYVSATQLNGQLPSDLPPGRSVIRVSCAGLPSEPLDVEVAAVAPGIFSLGQDRGAILNEDWSINAPDKPAPRGSVVTIYGTGQGAVAPPVADGGAASAEPLSVTPESPGVTVGGVRAEVLFSGLAPGFVGIWQVNTRVPSGAPVGGAVPVRITMAGAASNQVTMAVR